MRGVLRYRAYLKKQALLPNATCIANQVPILPRDNHVALRLLLTVAILRLLSNKIHPNLRGAAMPRRGNSVQVLTPVLTKARIVITQSISDKAIP